MANYILGNVNKGFICIFVSHTSCRDNVEGIISKVTTFWCTSLILFTVPSNWWTRWFNVVRVLLIILMLVEISTVAAFIVGSRMNDEVEQSVREVAQSVYSRAPISKFLSK
jgi:hypothetical protein